MQGPEGNWVRAEDIVPNRWYEPGETYPGNTKMVRKEWYSGRNYGLFSVLAGVRGSGPPIIEPRGLPHDISDETKELWGDAYDWHTPHYYTLMELAGNLHKLQDPEVYGQDFIDQVVNPMMELADDELGRDSERVRIVFWFDN